MRRRTLGDVHPEVASAITNLAFLLYDKGDRAAAIEMGRQSLEMLRHLFPDGHPDVADAMTSLARWLIDEGEYVDAEFPIGVHVDDRVPDDPAARPARFREIDMFAQPGETRSFD